MLTIVKATDTVVVDTTIVLIYGQPGAGKTTLGFMSEAPILLDFDKGAHRTAFRGDFVKINNWGEVQNLDAKELAPFKTIVVDTAGGCLDMLSMKIMSDNSKLRSNTGTLNQQGWGALKVGFSNWLKMLQSLKKDIILIAHDKEDKNGDNTIVRPEMSGSSYAALMKLADFVGYLYKENNDSILNFNGNDRWVGKNSAQLKPLKVPHFNDNPKFMANLLGDMKMALGATGNAHLIMNKFIDKISNLAQAAQSVDDLNKILTKAGTEIKNEPEFKGKNKQLGTQIRYQTDERAKELNAFFHDEEKRYFPLNAEPVIPEPVIEDENPFGDN